MQAVAGVFESSATARHAVDALQAEGVSSDRISFLAPGTPGDVVERRVPIDDGESPGMGSAVGGVVGGAVGLAAASLVLPGVGPITVAGMILAALAGAAGGTALMDDLEDRLSDGIPHDELIAYEDALAAGHAVVIVAVESDDYADEVRDLLRAAGADRVDPARADWATGLHDGPS
jgi:outer membrane lipoprotein SlyB